MAGVLDEESESQLTCVCVRVWPYCNSHCDAELLLPAEALQWREAIELNHRHRLVVSLLLIPTDIHFCFPF